MFIQQVSIIRFHFHCIR